MPKPIPTIYLPNAADQKALFDQLWTPTLRYMSETIRVDGWRYWLTSVDRCPWFYCDGKSIRANCQRDRRHTPMNSSRHFVEYLHHHCPPHA